MIVGRVHLAARRFELAEHSCDGAERLNPNDADILAEYGLALGYVDRSEEAETVLRKAIGLNPLAPDWYLWFLGNVLFSLGRYEEVVAVLGRMRDPTQGNRLLAACHGLLGRVEIARAYGREVLAAQPNFSIEAWNKHLPQDPRQGVTDRYVAGLRLAGLPP
ncbi:MAG: hypothetical protein WD673_11040 [Alphaproteobacteria bacterium]